MVGRPDVDAAVERAFRTTARGLRRWPDPHAQEGSPHRRSPTDDEYSRCLDPEKWRIVDARWDAWAGALESLGLALVERDVDVERAGEWWARSLWFDRIAPVRADAVPVVAGRILAAGRGGGGVGGGGGGGGIVLGAGDPAVQIEAIPGCGCDACDSGSRDVLDLLDEYMAAVVAGRFRHLRRTRRRGQEQSVMRIGDRRMGSNIPGRALDGVLDDPRGWIETTGAPWWPP